MAEHARVSGEGVPEVSIGHRRADGRVARSRRPARGHGAVDVRRALQPRLAPVPAMRLVFSDTDANRRAVAELRLLNLDSGALGDRYREDAIVIEPDADHFDLLDTARLTRHVDALVTER